MTKTRNPYIPSPQRLAELSQMGKPLEHKPRKLLIHEAFASQNIQKVHAYFWSRVDIKGDKDCWNWKRSTQAGYGRVIISQNLLYSHRVAAMLSGLLGGVWDMRQIRFTCDNKLCCNPAHLYAVKSPYGPDTKWRDIKPEISIPAAVVAADERRGIKHYNTGIPTEVTPMRRRGPNKRKSLPTGWVSPARQAWIDSHKKPDGE